MSLFIQKLDAFSNKRSQTFSPKINCDISISYKSVVSSQEQRIAIRIYIVMHINLEQNAPSIRDRVQRAPRCAKYRLISLNFSGSGEIIRQLARPCPYSNTYIRPLRLRPPRGRPRTF